MMGWSSKLRGGAEWDVLSRWRRWLCYLSRPGVTKPAVVTFTVDTVAPVITLDSPNDGQVTNQSTLPVAGAVSEPADLTLNAQAVTVLEDLTFATEIALSQGPNALILRATDAACNVGTLSLAVTLDSVPPPSPDPARIVVSAPAAGLVTVTGTPGSVEGGASVVVTAPGVQTTTTADADGSFTTSLAASAGQLLQIVPVDLAGNAGPTTSFVVPGGGGPTLPPDPATVAPNLQIGYRLQPIRIIHKFDD